MIDIHSHIVFDVDDGPKTLEESLALIEESYTQGVRTIVSTSHRRKGMFETPEEKIFTNFKMVKEEAEKRYSDLTIYYGGELYYTSDIITKLEMNKIPRMNGTQFALIEFSATTPWKEIHKGLSNVLRAGVTPIIAHIERYNALEENEERVKELIDMGCYTQINSAHVLKPKWFGDKDKVRKKRARYFLDKNLVHCVASDMHNLGTRPPYMKLAYTIIEKTYGLKRAKDLFINHPNTLLENEYL